MSFDLNELFSFIINVEKSEFFLKKTPTDYIAICFRIVTVQDWSKISLADAVCPLGTLNFSRFIDIDNLLVKKSKINAAG